MFCIYGFVNKFWTGRIFERLRKVCGDSNLSAFLLLWGIYIKKCISLVRICLQTRNASTKFRKTSALKKAEKSLEISRFLVFSMLHLNQTRIMCLQVNSDAGFVSANSDVPWRNTSPLVKQGLASDRDLPGLQNHAGKWTYVRLQNIAHKRTGNRAVRHFHRTDRKPVFQPIMRILYHKKGEFCNIKSALSYSLFISTAASLFIFH